jgi:membrane protein implicated in regulation of membrane protease activity
VGFGWQLQIVLFLVLAVIFVLAGRRVFGSSDRQDEPLLNRRGDQLVGQRATLAEPIVNGRGRIRINDTTWRIKGPDLPAGTEVHIVSFDPITLEMEVAV